MKDEALGTWEAACLMGVHWTRPKRMAESGLIASRAVCGQSGREVAIYSSKDCEKNFEEYDNSPHRGRGRERTALGLRGDILAKLGGRDRVRIAFDDAIGVFEAAEILGVWHTRVSRIVDEGKLVGRLLWSERASSPRLWVLSRRSCLELAKENRRLEAAGKKRGRPRAKSVAK